MFLIGKYIFLYWLCAETFTLTQVQHLGRGYFLVVGANSNVVGVVTPFAATSVVCGFTGLVLVCRKESIVVMLFRIRRGVVFTVTP